MYFKEPQKVHSMQKDTPKGAHKIKFYIKYLVIYTSMSYL